MPSRYVRGIAFLSAEQTEDEQYAFHALFYAARWAAPKEKSMKYSETDLYQPVKKFLTGLGYEVNAEVKGTDLAAVRGDELLIVELKLSFNMTLLFQALERQKLTDQVYVAIPRPQKAVSKQLRATIEVSKRMEIGLMTVALDSPIKSVDILVFPQQLKKAKDNKKKERLLKEIAGRSRDVNAGGSRGVKLNTAFRERNIKIACILERHGPMTAAELVHQFGCEKDANRLMRENFYGWFERIGKGVYHITSQGIQALDDGSFGELVAFYREQSKMVLHRERGMRK